MSANGAPGYAQWKANPEGGYDAWAIHVLQISDGRIAGIDFFVDPASLAKRRADWAKVVKVWYRVSDFVRDPKTRAEAVAIMAAKVGVKPEEYAANVPGTYFLSLPEAKARFKKGAGLDSLYGSSKVADGFNVANKVYKASQKVEDYIFPDFVSSM